MAQWLVAVWNGSCWSCSGAVRAGRLLDEWRALRHAERFSAPAYSHRAMRYVLHRRLTKLTVRWRGRINNAHTRIAASFNGCRQSSIPGTTTYGHAST
jgi:hypothetical protein